MSKLEELIQKYCPDGVEYVRLENIAHVYDGTHQTPEYKVSGIPFISVENIGNIYGSKKYISKEDFDKYKIKPQIGDVFMTRIGRIGACAVFDKQADVAYYVSLALIRPNLNCVNPEYLKYIIESQTGCRELRKRTLVNAVPIKINKDDIGQICIPLPPLPVQEEIVRVLDTFTELQAELQAELQKRLQQYNYYRDNLLSFEGRTDVEWKKLGDCITSLNTGLNPRQFFKLNTDDATNYYVTIREMHHNTIIMNEGTDRMNDEALRLCNNRSNLEKGDVLFSGTGTIGEVAALEETPKNWNIKEGVYSIKPIPSILNYRFLMYLLQSSTIRQSYLKKAAGGTVKSVPMGEMRRLDIPVPSIEEQQKIVVILDRFDTLTNDLSQGLPAEIEKRRQQYEYYRDKLLTFKRKEA